MRHILYISGSRADYGPMRRTLQAIGRDSSCRLEVLATSMHLDPVHGETWREIAGDGFMIAAKVFGRPAGDSLSIMAASAGRYLFHISKELERIKPDIVLVLGDRGEQLAAAMAAAFQNIVVVHIGGGSTSGSIDDSIRHAITKFAHYHLAALDEHARRIIQMGENPVRVSIVGLPGGDIGPDVIYSKAEICAQQGINPDKPYLLVAQHSVTHSQEQVREQITETLEAVAALDYPVLLANPNDDAGGKVILAMMQGYARRYKHLYLLPPLGSREHFASIMAHAGVMIGNSSSGIVEAMSVSLPVVNVGDRQQGREHLACLLNVDYDKQQIRSAINTALYDSAYQQLLADFKSPLIKKDTVPRIVKFLKELDLTVASRPKIFYDF